MSEKTKTQAAINRTKYDCIFVMLPNEAKDISFIFDDFKDGLEGYLTIQELMDLTTPSYNSTDILTTHFLFRYSFRTITEISEFQTLLLNQGYTDYINGAEISDIDTSYIPENGFGIIFKMDCVELLNKINNQE